VRLAPGGDPRPVTSIAFIPQKGTSPDGKLMWMVFAGTQDCDSFDLIRRMVRLK
jgi:hypothetical protein